MFNRTIWFLWLQGLSSAPDIIKMCLHSWRRENPDWNVVVLDETNLDQYTDILLDAEIKSRLSANWYADLIRLDLLNKHGGVWVDATCYCIQPLDLWLTSNLHAHLFNIGLKITSKIINLIVRLAPINSCRDYLTQILIQLDIGLIRLSRKYLNMHPISIFIIK